MVCKQIKSILLREHWTCLNFHILNTPILDIGSKNTSMTSSANVRGLFHPMSRLICHSAPSSLFCLTNWNEGKWQLSQGSSHLLFYSVFFVPNWSKSIPHVCFSSSDTILAATRIMCACASAVWWIWVSLSCWAKRCVRGKLPHFHACQIAHF